MNWTKEELDTLRTTNEIRISPKKRDGSLRKPTTIWVVSHDDEIYVRAWHGPSSSWYKVAQTTHEGIILVKRMEKYITFVEENDDNLNNKINEAYLNKYGKSQYAKAMIGSEQQKTTLKLIPQENN